MKSPIDPQFGKALRGVRRARGLSQEAFDQVSSRTYISCLERGIKQPTLAKIAQLAAVLKVSPISLVALSFAGGSHSEAKKMLARAGDELGELASSD